MKGYKLVLEGNDRRPSFVCERCAPGNDEIEIHSHRNKLRPRLVGRQPGMCVSCSGSGHQVIDGRASFRPCKECGGSGFCPECNGQFARSWTELPLSAQQEFISRLETGDFGSMGEEALSTLYPY